MMTRMYLTLGGSWSRGLSATLFRQEFGTAGYSGMRAEYGNRIWVLATASRINEWGRSFSWAGGRQCSVQEGVWTRPPFFEP